MGASEKSGAFFFALLSGIFNAAFIIGFLTRFELSFRRAKRREISGCKWLNDICSKEGDTEISYCIRNDNRNRHALGRGASYRVARPPRRKPAPTRNANEKP